jgi:methyltransferase-like protein/ubiquinone/menaquinone biosynthesis C-methylase UbiE
MSSPTQRNDYDLVPYRSHPFVQSHPDRLATVARLFGMRPPAVERCRVLELGCGQGGNLIPMALGLGDSRFLGIDLSARQIDAGRKVVGDLGLRNLELRHMSILDVDARLGKFDFILCHGVYSWVPAEVRDKILQICADNLSPGGVAYVSYNTYPGWHMRGMIRAMMSYHAGRFCQPQDCIDQARALLDFLAQAVPAENGPYHRFLESELEMLRQCSDDYLFHEHLEGVNDPVYFHQFVKQAADRGLQYLGEADLDTMVLNQFAPAVGKTLRSISADLVQMEQYMDFLRNRTFRQTLLCHESAALNRALAPESLRGLFVASQAQADSAAPDLQSDAVEHFRTANGTLSTPHPIVKAAMVLLRQAWPRAVPFEALVKEARTHLAQGSAPQPHSPKETGLALLCEAPEGPSGNSACPVSLGPHNSVDDARVLGTCLLECYASPFGLVELHAHAPRLVQEISARPLASALARVQAQASAVVTNLRHEMVRLSDLERHLLGLLDGTRDQGALLSDIENAVDQGLLTVQLAGAPVLDKESARAAVSEAVKHSLPQFAQWALLAP